MEGIWPLKDASDSPTLTGWSTTWRQRQSHCTLGSRPGSSQSASNSHQPNRLSSHPKPSQTCHVSRNSASTFSPCPFHHHCPPRMLEGWRRGMYQRAQHPPTQCSGLPSRKTAKETEESHFFIGKKKKKKSLTVEAQEQILQLHFLRSFAGYAHRSRSSRHPHASLI